MGFVDEVIFGREVLTRIPALAAEWKVQYEKLKATTKEPVVGGDIPKGNHVPEEKES